MPSPSARPENTTSPSREVHWALAMVMTAAAYLVTGLAGLLLAIPPSYASPIFPAAGVALASVLVFGWRMVAAVSLGAFLVNLTVSAQRGNLELAAVGLPAVIAVGAGVQAWVGATLVRRFVHQPLTLSEPRDIARFFGLGTVTACLISASIATAALGLTRTVGPDDLAIAWLTWWAGDSLGVLIAAPITLTLIGRPRSAWVPRRLPLGLTLALVTALVALTIKHMARDEDDHRRLAFEHEAASVSAAMASQLQEPLHALEAIRGVFIASEDVSREEMHLASQTWAQSGSLQALGWSERVRRSQIAGFEARARAGGLPAYRVFDRPESAAAAPTAIPEAMAIRYLEPMQGNATALGLNVLSVPAARAAIESTTAHDRPAATVGFRLTQQEASSEQPGVVVYRAIYSGTPSTPAERAAAMRGAVFVAIRVDALLNQLLSALPSHLHVCVVDVDPLAPMPRLAGAPGCEAMSTELLYQRAVEFAGRQWSVRVSARKADMPEAHGLNIWLFSLTGLGAVGMLGTLLLLVTGRTRLIEAAVRERTQALESEVREREVAQAALRESEQRLRNILDNVPIGVIYTDLRGNVKQANPRFCELVGYAEDDLLLMASAEYTHPEDVAQDVDLSTQLVHGDIPLYRRHKRYVTSDGRTVWVQETVSLLRDARGRPQHIVGAVEDISEHLRLQEAENARELAEAANHAKSEFLSRMSHELRTPLNAMLGFAQLLELDQRHPLAAAQRPWVGQIQQAGWHLLEMINDVLDLSRIESGNLRLQTEALDLGELLDATLAMVTVEARQRGIAITTEMAAGTKLVLGDSTRVKQILTNLLTNAVKYNSDAGRIHVASRLRAPDSVEIAVTDTGMGMTPQQVAELFQPFNRLGRERSTLQGTGIGLVISKRLAELMGGSLRARSVTGEGSSFILTLPRVVDPDTVRSDLGNITSTQSDYHGRLVHYVEDNETNVEVMRGILAQRPQVQMQVSTTGLDGLASIRTQRPDLILLDMHLPDIHGLELLRHLKADLGTATIPVVVVSADALEKQIDAALNAGATRYLTKPVSVAELLAVLDELLEHAETRVR